jgi:ABC-type branched-subunit amino acid transport system ATPase component/ABC-type branched-subunit amino acid transport system permease subunit
MSRLEAIGQSLAARIPTMNRVEGAHTTSRPVLNSMRSPGAMLLALALVTFPMWRPPYLVFTANAGIPVAIVGLGLLVLVGWTREISLVAAGIFASSAYYDGYLNRPHPGGHNFPWGIAAIITIAGAGITMALIALSSARLPGIYLVVLTYGVQVILEKTVFTYGYLSGGLGGGDENGNIVVNRRPWFFGLNLNTQATHRWFGHDITQETIFYFFSLGWLAIVLVLMVRLRRSPMGLGFLLVGADRQAAAAVGVSPLKFRVLAFTTSGLLAGVAGVLVNWLYVNPPASVNYYSPYSLVLLAIPVVAGLDSIAFVVIFGINFELIPVVLESFRISPFILAAFGLLPVALFGTRGIGGRLADLWRYIQFGDRRSRTLRERVDTARMRTSKGLAGDASDNLSPKQREEALAILEAWLPPRPESTNAIKADGIKVRFGNVKALDGASIVVPNHAMVGLLGPNGAGKTTLFDVISGVRAPNGGTVNMFDKNVTGLSAWDRSKLGMARTFQNTRVMPDLTVADNLVAGAYQRIKSNPALFLAGVPSAWAEMRAAEEAAFAAARLLDIDRYWNERCGSLEFSARRRTEIGRCLLSGPRLLLLDEPAAGLDPASSVALFTLIKKLHEDLGLTVLLVEHYVKAVLDSCDLVYVLAEGKVLAQGTPTEVAANPDVRSRYLGTRMSFAPSAVTALNESVESENGSGRHAGAAAEETPAEAAETTVGT